MGGDLCVSKLVANWMSLVYARAMAMRSVVLLLCVHRECGLVEYSVSKIEVYNVCACCS